ncbi:MAG: ATP-dependent Clp protease adaptor ClpS [Crocinitomicaceae bacterium]|nr:ATP-dependent Clp protease adaptor ClpS [Crocinitomicaceae bacterium]MBK8924813.1 ATP-dependent Clp protease adaptor ClpS [Crocinitomicaceae bacterium]
MTQEQAETLVLTEEETITQLTETRDLMIYNDDFNTFDHVIESLIKVCRHDPIQAEQCTMIIHYNGKCSVKKGTYEILNPMRQALNERGIDAKIV